MAGDPTGAGYPLFPGQPGYTPYNPKRQLSSQFIRQFRGINQYAMATLVTPEFALDCLNVIPSNAGGIEKLRVPTSIMNATGGAVSSPTGPVQLADYQKADGTRCYVAQFGTKLWTRYINPATADFANLLDTGVTDIIDMLVSNNVLFGCNGHQNFKFLGESASNTTYNWGIAAPTDTPTTNTTAGNVTLTVGRKYCVAGRNATDGHIGSAGPSSASTGPVTDKIIQVQARYLNDPQVTNLDIYATLDGGGDFYYLDTVANHPGAGNFTYDDDNDDSALNTLISPSFINNPPPVFKYMCSVQNRIFGAVADAPQDVAYSGYERIFVGQPNQSFPPNNRLRLPIGADSISGLGALQNGLVVWDQSNKMYMMSGIMEDITNTAPVSFTSYLTELPWTIGCLSHFSVATTPFGVVWLASDSTVQVFAGQGLPSDISQGVYPILKRITPGQGPNARGCYLNYVERDWYALAIAVDGATTNNMVILFDLTMDPNENAGCWVIDLGTIGQGADSIAIMEDVNGQRQLVIGTSGQLWLIKVLSDAVNGTNYQNDGTSNTLEAYWQTGYFGGENPHMVNQWRFGRLVVDSPGFSVRPILVDHDIRTFRQPEQLAAQSLVGDRFAVNRKSRLCSLMIQFPSADTSCMVQEVSLSRITVGQR